MKKYAYLMVVGFLSLAACTPSANVSTDYDIATNFRAIKTYGWFTDKEKPTAKKDTAQYDTFFDKRMKKAIETELSRQGLTYSATNPDVYVNFKAGISNQQRYRDNGPMGYGRYGYGYPFGGTSVQQYKEGTITIDLVDAKKNELLWRGIGETEVGSRNISEEKVYDLVNNIMREYPPRPDRR